MELEKFKQLVNLITENFKAVGYKRIYEINDETFVPFVYKDFYVCASYLNTDKDHIITRLKSRTKYTISDIFLLIKQGIDKFLADKYEQIFKNNTTHKFEKTEQNFCILSKSKPDVKIGILISKNTAYDPFKTDHSEFYSAKYICFVHTILDKTMIPHKDDKQLIVENKLIIS